MTLFNSEFYGSRNSFCLSHHAPVCQSLHCSYRKASLALCHPWNLQDSPLVIPDRRALQRLVDLSASTAYVLVQTGGRGHSRRTSLLDWACQVPASYTVPFGITLTDSRCPLGLPLSGGVGVLLELVLLSSCWHLSSNILHVVPRSALIDYISIFMKYYICIILSSVK